MKAVFEIINNKPFVIIRHNNSRFHLKYIASEHQNNGLAESFNSAVEK